VKFAARSDISDTTFFSHLLHVLYLRLLLQRESLILSEDEEDVQSPVSFAKVAYKTKNKSLCFNVEETKRRNK